MVRPPKIRHSKARRDPVTIDLDPADVKRGDTPAKSPDTAKSDAAASSKAGPVDARPSDASAAPASNAGKANASPDEKPAGAKTGSTSSASSGAGPAASEPKTAADAVAAKGPAQAPGEPYSTQKPAASASAVKVGDEPDEAKPAGAASSPASGGETSGGRAAPVFGRGASDTGKQSVSAEPERSSSATSASSASSPAGERGVAPPPVPSAAPRRRGLSMLAAGVIGGVIVLVGAGALQYAGVLPAPGAGGEQGGPAGLAEIRAELASLREQVGAGGAGQADPAQSARVEELAGALEGLRTDLADLRSSLSQGEGGVPAAVTALDDRLSDLEEAVASLRQAAGGGEVDLAPLQERLGAVESRLEQVAQTAQSAEQAASGLPERLSSLDQRLAALDARLSDLAARVEEQASNPRIALAIAAAGLKAAIDRGDPFMTELETYAAIAPDAPEIASLRELAASGVPTRASIADDVNAAAGRMIAAADPVPEDAGFFGRLLDSMQSVVTVRPIGDVEGEGVDAIVARMEAAIRAGDYARAISEYETLPEPARQAGADFIARVQARQAADELVAKALAGALRSQEG